ncbi:hypothetical protein [Puniceibacterium confluentis]|uniref:hypothetical protein n=1 Tax=Puniceibacterium confluentis TaxID=1958944 RepID=UPI0011B62869|nr:hypothetical protein [Puniceibacterium confluentis]
MAYQSVEYGSFENTGQPISTRYELELSPPSKCLALLFIGFVAGLLLTAGVIVKFDLHFAWAVPLHAVLGTASILIMVAINTLTPKTSD